MEGRLQNGYAVVLEHVQKGGLSGIIETEKEEFGVLVRKAEVGEDFPNYAVLASCWRCM